MKKLFSFLTSIFIIFGCLIIIITRNNIYAATTYSRNELKSYVRNYYNNSSYDYSKFNSSADVYINRFSTVENPNFFGLVDKVFLDVKSFENGPGFTFKVSSSDGYTINFSQGYHYFVDADFVWAWLCYDVNSFNDADVYIYGYDDATIVNDDFFYGSSSELNYISSTYFDNNQMYSNSGVWACIISTRSLDFMSSENVSHDDFTFYRYKSVDVIYPNFTNNDYYINFNVDNPLSHAEILGKIGAVDETDGNISDRVKLVSTTYNPSSFSLTTYPFKVSVSDSAGNVTRATFYIRPYDIGVPVITGTSLYNLSYNDELTLEMIKSNIQLSDNFDTSLVLNVVSDTYSGNEKQVGNYSVVFNTTDTAGNTSSDFVVNIVIKDEVPPVISVPNSIEIPSSTLMTYETLKSKISVIDEYCGLINDYEIIGFNVYEEKYNVVGTYNITVNVVDSSNNNSTVSFDLIVVDKISPEIFIEKNFIISVPTGTELTEDMVLSYLDQIGEIDIAKVSSVAYCLNNSNDNSYNCYLMMDDGTEYKAVVKADVVDNPDVSTNEEKSEKDFMSKLEENKIIVISLSCLIIVIFGFGIFSLIKFIKKL